MCRFASRCENFHPDHDNPSNCLLICQKNPLALAIALMPDRYVEKDMLTDPDRKIVDMNKTLSAPQSRGDKLQDDYNEMVSATQEHENEFIEFDPDILNNLEEKFKASPSTDINKLIKKSNKSRNSTEMQEDVTQAIIDNVTDDGEPVEIHPLDDINFEPVERIAIADQPETPNNPEVYIKTRERGRPKMTAEEKETSRLKREKEKKLKEEEKQEEAIKRREAMKKKVAKNKKNKSKKN